MEAHKRRGQAVGADAMVGLVGFAPPIVHSLGARLASQFSSQLYNVLVTNVPGPPRPLYALGARMLDMFPVVPLAGGQAVAIGITSYDGGVHYGLTADRDALPDVDVLAAAMSDALAELVPRRPDLLLVSPGRCAAPRGSRPGRSARPAGTGPVPTRSNAASTSDSERAAADGIPRPAATAAKSTGW